MPTSIVEEWLRVNKRKINGIYIEGDVVDLKHLLFHRKRDFLIKNNNDQVRAEHLEGKVVVLYFVSVTRRHRWMRKNIMYLLDIYTELVSLSRPFEIVLVAIMDERDDPIISEKIFQELFSIMPWTAIPFSDSETRRQLVKSFLGSKPTNYTDLSFVISETGVLLLENATGRMSLYGTEAYPFDKQSLQRVQFEDEEARVTPSLKNLLVSPQRDYVINNKGDKVSICDLEDKVVALFLYEEHRTSRLLTNTLRDAYKHWAEEKKMKFEVVLIYISVTTHTIDCTNAESFQKVFETMPWLAIPFNDRNCKKLLRVCNYPSELGLGPEPDPSLLIIGPHGEFFEPWGSTILMNFGIDAYPWNYDKVCMMQIEKVQKFNLNMLWDAETVFIREFGSKEVRFSEINVGKRIVVYSDYTMRDELYREFRMKLKKKYLERRGRDDEFEVIYLNLYYNNEEKFPWLRLQPGHEDYDRNVSAANDVFTHLLRDGIGILVFDVDGKIVRATSYPTFEEEKREQQKREQELHASSLRVPRRLPWNAKMSVEELDTNERKAFLIWRRDLASYTQVLEFNISMILDNENLVLTPFEKNLDIWRQLWRVLEHSDLPYAKEIDEHKRTLLLINKADLLPHSIREKWAKYFRLHGILFVFWSAKVASAVAEGKELLSEMLNGHDESVDADTRVYGREELLARLQSEAEEIATMRKSRSSAPSASLVDSSGEVSQRYVKFNGVTVGFVGYPNVGKSSTINALVGEKKTGVTHTPGKTKHFQTIIISDKLTLCDCPGLVFPSFTSSRYEMIASGVLPIDRMTEHREAIQVAANQVPRHVIESVYKISLPRPKTYEPQSRPPLASEFLRAYCASRGYVASSGLPDETRAARIILKDYIDGKLPHYKLPPGMSNEEAIAEDPTYLTTLPESFESDDDSSDDENHLEGENEKGPSLEHVLDDLSSFDIDHGLASSKALTKKKPSGPSHKQHKKPQRSKNRSWRVKDNGDDGMAIVKVFQKPLNSRPVEAG